MNALTINKTTKSEHENGVLPRGNNTRYTGQGVVWQIVCGDEILTGFRKKLEAEANLEVFELMTDEEKQLALKTDFAASVFMKIRELHKTDKAYSKLFNVIGDAKEI